MILIDDLEKSGIKVRLPGKFSCKIEPSTVYYIADDYGLLFRSERGEKKVVCDKHVIRTVTLFDIVMIKAKQYNHNQDNILYNNKPLAKSGFPSMGLYLTEEEFRKERILLSELYNGFLLTDPLRNKDFELLLDLFEAKGL